MNKVFKANTKYIKGAYSYALFPIIHIIFVNDSPKLIAFCMSLFIFGIIFTIHTSIFKTVIIKNDGIYSQNFFKKESLTVISYFKDILEVENHANQSLMIIEKNQQTVLHISLYLQAIELALAIDECWKA